jgi:hypothetical protein
MKLKMGDVLGEKGQKKGEVGSSVRLSLSFCPASCSPGNHTICAST